MPLPVRRVLLQTFVQLTFAAGLVCGVALPSSSNGTSQGIDDTLSSSSHIHRRKVPAECGPAVAVVHFETPAAPSGLPVHLRELLANAACPAVLAVAEASSSLTSSSDGPDPSRSMVTCCFAAVSGPVEPSFAIQLHSIRSTNTIVQAGGSALPPAAPIDSASLCSTFGAIAAALDANQIVADVLGVEFTGTTVEVLPGTTYAAAFAAASCPRLRGRVTSSSTSATMTASVIQKSKGKTTPSSVDTWTPEERMGDTRAPWLAVHAENGQAGVESSPTPVFGIPGVYEGTMLVPTRASGLLAIAESATSNPFKNYVAATYFPSPTSAAAEVAAESTTEDVLELTMLRDAASNDTIVALKVQSIMPTLLNTAVISGKSVTSPIAVAGITALGDVVKLPSTALLLCTSFVPAVVQTDGSCNLVLQSSADAGAEEASISVIYLEQTGKSLQAVISVRVLYPRLVRLMTQTPTLRPIGHPIVATSAEVTSASADEGSAYYDDDDFKEEECTATHIFERTPVKAVAYFYSASDANDDYDGGETAAAEDHSVVEMDVTRLALPFLTSSNPEAAQVVDGWVVGRSVGRALIVRAGSTNMGIEWRSCSISVAASPALEVVGLESRLANDADLRVSSSGFPVSAGISRYFYTVTVSPASLSPSRRTADLIVNAVLSDGSRFALTSEMGLTVVSDNTLAVDVVSKGSTFVVALPTVALADRTVRIKAAWKLPGCDQSSTSPTHKVNLVMETASLTDGFVQLPELRLTSTRQRLSSGTSMRDASAAVVAAAVAADAQSLTGLPVFAALSLKLAQHGDLSEELSENPSIELSTNVIAGSTSLVTLVDNMIIANTEGRAGTVVVSAWVRGRTDLSIAQVTIDVLASSDPRWASLLLTQPAVALVVESQGSSADTAAYDEWIATNGKAIAFAEEVRETGSNTDSVSWAHKSGTKSLVDPRMPLCSSWSQAVYFTATHKSLLTGDTQEVETSAVFTIVDTEAPVFSTPPASNVVTVLSGGEQAALLDWQAEHGEGVAFDVGSNLRGDLSWAWTATLVAVEDASLWAAGCSETYRTTFTVVDVCGNIARAVADLTIITSPLQLRTLGVPAELSFGYSGSSTANAMQNWMTTYSAALVADSSGPVQWSESSLAPQADVVYSTLLSNSKSTVNANEVVCSSSSFQGSHTATDTCGGTAVLKMDWILVERTPIDGSKAASSTGILSPFFETEPTNVVTESGGAESLDMFKDWLENKANAVLGADYEKLAWKSPELNWAAKVVSGCAPSQVCTATFAAADRCGTLFGYTATFTIVPDCISAKLAEVEIEADFRAQGAAGTFTFPSWADVAIATEFAAGSLGGITPSESTSEDVALLSSETWAIIAVSLGIIFISFGIAIWCKRHPEGTFNNKPYYPDANRSRAAPSEAERAARAMQRAYANRHNPTHPHGVRRGDSSHVGRRRQVQFAPEVYMSGEQHPPTMHHPSMHHHTQELDYALDLDLDGQNGSMIDESEFPDGDGQFMSGIVTTRAQLEANDREAESRMTAMLGDMEALQNRIGLLKKRASSGGLEWDNEDQVASLDPYGGVRGNGLDIRLSSGQAYPAYPQSPGNNREKVAEPPLFSPASVAAYDMVSSANVEEIIAYDVAGMAELEPALEPAHDGMATYDVAVRTEVEDSGMATYDVAAISRPGVGGGNGNGIINV